MQQQVQQREGLEGWGLAAAYPAIMRHCMTLGMEGRRGLDGGRRCLETALTLSIQVKHPWVWDEDGGR